MILYFASFLNPRRKKPVLLTNQPGERRGRDGINPIRPRAFESS